MNVTKRAALFVTLCAMVLCTLVFCSSAQAVPGSVYAGTLERCYKHPVTGVIEDSGGKASAATGQAMVEGCLSAKCMLEATDGGQYFLTVRLGLVDYTRNRDFTVQKWGAKKWTTTKFAVAKKTKMNGDAACDYCIRVPSSKCIVRITMFVKPIGREVVGYFYPCDLKLGTPKDMTAKIVTEKSKTSGKSKEKPATGEAKKADASASESSELKAGGAVGTAQGLTLSATGEADDGGQDADARPVMDLHAWVLVGALVIAATVGAAVLARAMQRESGRGRRHGRR